jgi:hypothetical protein
VVAGAADDVVSATADCSEVELSVEHAERPRTASAAMVAAVSVLR